MRTYDAYATVKSKINHLRKVNTVVKPPLETDPTKTYNGKGANEIIIGDFWTADVIKYEKFLRDVINTHKES